MATITTSTPRLNATQKWIDAYITLDIEKLNPVLSITYKHQTSPKSTGGQEETMEEYLQRYGGVLSISTKFEVYIQHWMATIMLAD